MNTDTTLRIPALSKLPIWWRALITCALLFLGGGYFAAQLNILAQNELADGVPGLSADDLRIRYSGMFVKGSTDEPPPSRMLEMIRGDMRENFTDDASFDVMLNWLRKGASEADFASGPAPTPADVLVEDCLRCHAAEGGKKIGQKSPLGRDTKTASYQMVSKFAPPSAADGRVWHPPRDWRDLAMTTHAHLLAVPMFVLLLAVLFLWSGAFASRPALRSLLACAPLAIFLLDVSFWWLARLPGVGPIFALAIGVTGALFGVCYLTQWVIVLIALWRRSEPAMVPPRG